MNKDMFFLFEGRGTFYNHSKDSRDFLRDEFSVENDVGDSIYIGLYKPFNSFYVELKTPLVIDAVLTHTINGNSLDMDDDTKAFKRSGFNTFEKPDSWVAEEINGITAYWVKITSPDVFTVEFQGCNLVFADDTDLKTEIRNIDILLAKGDTSFIAYHQGVRDEIIQTLRNGGHLKESEDQVAELTKWDLLDFGEIRNAAKYLCLAKIFFDVSKNNDDKYYGRFRDFQGMYGNAFDTYILKLDTKDDGIYDQEDDLEFNSAIEISLG